MPDTVVARVNELGKNEPEQFVFADRSSRLIGDNELPGVDGDENETPQDEDDVVQDLDHASVIEEMDLETAPHDETEEAATRVQPAPAEPFVEPRTKVETANEDGQVKREPAQAKVDPATMPDATAAPEAIPGVRRGRHESRSHPKDTFRACPPVPPDADML